MNGGSIVGRELVSEPDAPETVVPPRRWYESPLATLREQWDEAMNAKRVPADALKDTADALERFITLDPRDESARRQATAHGSWVLSQLVNVGLWEPSNPSTAERWVEVRFRGLLAEHKLEALRSLDMLATAAAVAAPFGFTLIEGMSAVPDEVAS